MCSPLYLLRLPLLIAASLAFTAWASTLAVAAQVPVHARSVQAMSPQDEQALHTALDAYDAGDARTAEPALQMLSRRYPGNFEASEALGSLYAEAGDLPRALSLLQHAAVLAPDQPLALANLGAAYLQQSRLPEALRTLKRAAALDPANTATEKNLGHALMLVHRPGAAATAFAAAAAGAPNDPQLRYDWALALYGEGAAAAAAAVLDVIPAAAATDQIHALAGDANECAGRYTKALTNFETAARQNPSAANLYALTGELMRHWNWAEAIQIAQYSAKLYPDQPRFGMASGIAMFGNGDYSGAVGVFSGLLMSDPENATVADLLGRSCSALADGEYTGCNGVYDFAERHPGNAVMTTYAAVALLHAPGNGANLGKAEALLRTAIANAPHYAEAYLRMGTLQQLRLQWAESAKTLQRAVALNPASPEAHYRLSRAYAHLGRREEAQAQTALHQSCAEKAKATQNARMQEVVQFVLTPS